jgi:hypothetical protein
MVGGDHGFRLCHAITGQEAPGKRGRSEEVIEPQRRIGRGIRVSRLGGVQRPVAIGIARLQQHRDNLARQWLCRDVFLPLLGGSGEIKGKIGPIGWMQRVEIAHQCMWLLSYSMQDVENSPYLPAAKLLVFWSEARFQMGGKEGYRTIFSRNLDGEQRFREPRQAIILRAENRQPAQPCNMKLVVGFTKGQMHIHLLRQYFGVSATIGLQQRHHIGLLLLDHPADVWETILSSTQNVIAQDS